MYYRTLIFSIFLLLSGYVTSATYNDNQLVSVNYKNVIPLPVEFEQTSGYFVLGNIDKILINAKQDNVKPLAEYLKAELTVVLMPSVTIEPMMNKQNTKSSSDSENKVNNQVILLVSDDIKGGKEAYEITIEEHVLTLVGGSAAGIFRGIQTIKQLLPLLVETKQTVNKLNQNTKAALNIGVIKDYPRYEHRGFMLDVARHFYTVDEVKAVIDYLAAYKYNVFHFHLTDDQGWRINIPSWPKLTSIGSNSAVDQISCEKCFYSLDEYQDIVKYADERFITLIPEIDVPGHVRAALASYPDELYCEGDKPVWPYTGQKVRISSLCFSNPKIYDFFEDVVSEVAKRTTGQYIHVGGDETPKWVKHSDYTDFMLKANDIVAKHGKTLVGWTNDLGSVKGLSSDVVGQDWSTNQHCCENTLNMANRGSKIIMSPANKAYLDLKYDENTALGLNWAGYNSIENSYNWNPELMIEGLNSENIIGIEAALWGETIKTMADAQYMIFPRLLSLSEVAWTPQEKRKWPEFLERIENHLKGLKQQGINFKPL
jgi:hexosaminidase